MSIGTVIIKRISVNRLFVNISYWIRRKAFSLSGRFLSKMIDVPFFFFIFSFLFF